MTLAQVRAILTKYSPRFVRAYIYGSVAGGREDAYSDVDLLLVRETRGEFFDRIREVLDLVRELGAVDLLIYTPEELSELIEIRHNAFLARVLEQGVTVEGSQGRRSALAPTG